MNWLRLGAVGVLLLLPSSCSSDSSAPADQPDVIYVGDVTDEALDRLLALTPKNDPTQAVIVDSPDLSIPLTQDGAATFQYHVVGSEAMRAPARRRQSAPPPSSNWQRAFHALGQFLSLEGTAYAHGDPYNGPAYYLVISDADAKPKLRIFTDQTSYTPEASDWQTLVQARQPLSLAITWAFFEQNAIHTDGGPFVGGTFPFTIQ